MCGNPETGYCEWQRLAPPVAPGNALQGLNCACFILVFVPIFYTEIYAPFSFLKTSAIETLAQCAKWSQFAVDDFFRQSDLRLKITFFFEIMLKHCSEAVCTLVLYVQRGQPRPANGNTNTLTSRRLHAPLC